MQPNVYSDENEYMNIIFRMTGLIYTVRLEDEVTEGER